MGLFIFLFAPKESLIFFCVKGNEEETLEWYSDQWNLKIDHLIFIKYKPSSALVESTIVILKFGHKIMIDVDAS